MSSEDDIPTPPDTPRAKRTASSKPSPPKSKSVMRRLAAYLKDEDPEPVKSDHPSYSEEDEGEITQQVHIEIEKAVQAREKTASKAEELAERAHEVVQERLSNPPPPMDKKE